MNLDVRLLAKEYGRRTLLTSPTVPSSLRFVTDVRSVWATKTEILVLLFFCLYSIKLNFNEMVG